MGFQVCQEIAFEKKELHVIFLENVLGKKKHEEKSEFFSPWCACTIIVIWFSDQKVIVPNIWTFCSRSAFVFWHIYLCKSLSGDDSFVCLSIMYVLGIKLWVINCISSCQVESIWKGVFQIKEMCLKGTHWWPMSYFPMACILLVKNKILVLVA